MSVKKQKRINKTFKKKKLTIRFESRFEVHDTILHDFFTIFLAHLFSRQITENLDYLFYKNHVFLKNYIFSYPLFNT